ncbi:VPS13A_C [Mytilus coruscus]|uniref:VPS13A_C n=1 Tax=Mytilus coruscus TaxID=42192 RepID=A0A6J8EUG4_MYTCO|nr:VPS13A_C [Mytilus coruscus]
MNEIIQYNFGLSIIFAGRFVGLKEKRVWKLEVVNVSKWKHVGNLLTKKTFQEQFKSDEKSELYTAIGYAETDSDITRPKEYIAAKLEAKFAKMTLTLIDDQSRDPYIIKFHLKDVFSSLQQRPAAKAIKFEANVKTYTVNGTPQEGLIPDMVTSQANMTDNKNHLLDVLFETNPLDEACDTRVKLNTRHIEFIYDAVTVNNLVNFFKPPDSVNLQELTQTAVNTIDAIMERSATGLSHFINQKKVTEISVDIQPSYVIIPKIGWFKKDSCALILDLGNLKMETVDEPTTTAYDRFNITLDRFQILFSSSGDDWRVYRKESKSHMHLLEPIEMHIVLQKCRLDKDPNLAKIKLSAELPLLSLNMSDKRLHELIELADSIPLPESAVLPRKEFSLLRAQHLMYCMILLQARSFRNMKKKDKANSLRSKVDISIHQVDDGQVVRLKVASLGTEVAIHTCDIDVEAYLRGIILQHEVDGQVVNLVNSPREDGPTNLLHVHYIKTKKDDPNFDTAYGKIEQKIDVAFTRLQIILYQEAVLHVLELVHKMKQAAKRQKYIVTVRTEEGKDRKKEEKRTKYGTRYESARLQDLSGTPYVDKNDPLKQRDYKEALSEIEIQGITVCGKQMSDKSIEVNVKLQDIVLEDSRHHKTDGITRMIQRRQSPISKDGISNMIDVSYKQDCSEDSTDRIKKPSLSSYCMDIVVKIENPEIILIEDQLNPYCNCLVLNTETTLKMKVHPEYQKISTKVNDLQIFSCVFSNREAVAAQILNKSEIWFESEKNFNKGTEMRIETSNLIFNISPATIKTISKICAALATTPELKKETCTYTVPHDLWEVKKLVDSDFWFLSEEPEKQEEELVNVDAEWKVRLEQLIAKIPLMIIRIEGGVGMRTVPLLRVESSISADVKNWTSKLSVEGTLKFEVAYHNEKLSVWEPLLEPIVEDGKKERWELGLEAFGDAYMLVEPSVKAGEILSPFCIRNQLDLEVVITLDDSLKVEESNDLKVKIPPGKQSKLWNKKKRENISEIEATQDGDEKTFNFLFEKLNVTKEVTVKRAEKRLYKINTPTKSEEVLTFIVNTETPIGQKIVSIQSNIKIKNHFQIPIEVYYVDDTITCCGVVASDTDFSVPLTAVYTQRKEFQFKPNYETYHRSASVSWKDSKKFGTVQLLKCEPTNRCLPFYITVKVDVEDVYFEVGNTLSAKSYIFHLSPTFILHNLLPYPIRVQLEGIAEERTLQKGENTALLHACFEKNSCVNITILTYKGKEWSGKSLISSNIPEQSILTFEANQCTPKCTLNLGLHCKKNDGCMDISVYSPYWMVNKTRQDLFYKATDSDAVKLEHDNLDIVMFSFKEKTLLSFTKRVSI